MEQAFGLECTSVADSRLDVRHLQKQPQTIISPLKAPLQNYRSHSATTVRKKACVGRDRSRVFSCCTTRESSFTKRASIVNSHQKLAAVSPTRAIPGLLKSNGVLFNSQSSTNSAPHVSLVKHNVGDALDLTEIEHAEEGTSEDDSSSASADGSNCSRKWEYEWSSVLEEEEEGNISGTGSANDSEDLTSESESLGSSLAKVSLGEAPSSKSSFGLLKTSFAAAKDSSELCSESPSKETYALKDKKAKPVRSLPLLSSLFENKPPTLFFTAEDTEGVSSFPLEIRSILKWKSSTVTPKVIRASLARTGFKITKKNSDWLGLWGKHMKSESFRSVKEYQKVNHFPGTFHIGRKDKLWRNFCRMRILFGKKEYNFIPPTFVLPHDTASLRKAWDDCGSRGKWIVKPPASARGIGIKVINRWGQIPKKRPLVVQRYISKPYLINESKFDLRIYVYVASYDPLRVYICEDGLVRFATSKYSSSSKFLSNKFMHLTNYSINKKNTDAYVSTATADDVLCHKWGLQDLWSYFEERCINSSSIWSAIKDIVVKTVICGDASVNSLMKQNCRSRYSCHELFGFDIILDSNLKPWLLEVNISPSLHSQSALDVIIKSGVVKDVLNMAGFFIPSWLCYRSSGRVSGIDGITADRLWFAEPTLSSDEKAKHACYVQKFHDVRARSNVLEILTPNDIRILMETEDELSRSGRFTRVFPSQSSKPYLNFFTVPRYYNILLDEWTKRYMRDALRPSLGIALLQSYAKRAVHLGNESDPDFQWCRSPVYAFGASSASSDSAKSGMLTPALSGMCRSKTYASLSSPTRGRQMVVNPSRLFGGHQGVESLGGGVQHSTLSRETLAYYSRANGASLKKDVIISSPKPVHRQPTSILKNHKSLLVSSWSSAAQRKK